MMAEPKRGGFGGFIKYAWQRTFGGGAPNYVPLTGSQRTISPELLSILADPEDRGPVEQLFHEGREWLANPQTGNLYPVENGIPIMLEEEGVMHRLDTEVLKGLLENQQATGGIDAARAAAGLAGDLPPVDTRNGVQKAWESAVEAVKHHGQEFMQGDKHKGIYIGGAVVGVGAVGVGINDIREGLKINEETQQRDVGRVVRGVVETTAGAAVAAASTAGFVANVKAGRAAAATSTPSL